MISRVDKAIIKILLKVASILTNYSKHIGNYDLYNIAQEIENLSSCIEEDKESEENGDKG